MHCRCTATHSCPDRRASYSKSACSSQTQALIWPSWPNDIKEADSGRTQMVIGSSSEGAKRVMNTRSHSPFLMAGFLTVGVIPGYDKGIIMLRSIGSVTALALFMVGCGGGGGGDSGPPRPPP